MALEYNDLYEYLRKEKYGDQLQNLPKDFVSQVSKFIKEKRVLLSKDMDSFSEDSLKMKKNFENSISIFKELMLRRKKKILELVFVASETGIMKKDFGSMFSFEKETFERLVSVINDSDKNLNAGLNGDSKEKEEPNKMIIMNQRVEEFIDLQGSSIGPFNDGELVNLDKEVAEILVSGGKAGFVDE